jgi:hypothetical protein
MQIKPNHIFKNLLLSVVFLCFLSNFFAQKAPLQVTSLGQQGAPLPNGGFDTKNIISNIAVVTFQNAPTSKYAIVKLPQGTKLREGTVAKVWDDTYKWGNGGGKQFKILDWEKLPEIICSMKKIKRKMVTTNPQMVATNSQKINELKI